MTFPALLDHVASGDDLSREEANRAMGAIMAGDLEEAQIGGLLVGLRMKGVTAPELAGFADAMRGNALALDHDFPNLVDTCGTGGGPSTFNLSTGAAILAAAAGAKVAKHGRLWPDRPCWPAGLGRDWQKQPQTIAITAQK